MLEFLLTLFSLMSGSMFGEVLGGGFDDARALGFGTRADSRLTLIERGSDAIAGNSRHNNDFQSC